MAAFLYVMSLTAAALATYAGCWVAVGIFAVLAGVLAVRYELRWLADHTPLTKHRPRAVPRWR